MDWTQKVVELRRRIRKERPLIHHITNWVVTNVTANATLATGASPVMAHAVEEAADMARAARALVLNIGTLTPATVEAMLKAGRAANEAGVPVIFDPVGAGATPLRTGAAKTILQQLRIDILRGNASEIACIGGFEARIRGVDAAGGPADVAGMARKVAQQLGAVVAVTGARDYISDGERTVAVDNGHPLLTFVTGTGCMATSIIAAFRAVEGDGLVAAATALAFYGLAAEKAAASSRGPGSFQVALFDYLYNLSDEDLGAGIKILKI